MEWLKINAVPLEREKTVPLALQELLPPGGGALHLRWYAENGQTACMLGLPDALTLQQAKLRLQLAGYLAVPAPAPRPETAQQLLRRTTQSRYERVGEHAARRLTLPEHFLAAGSMEPLLWRLCNLPGCAVHCILRRSPGLGDSLARQLQEKGGPPESLPAALLAAPVLYEAVLAVTGDSTGLLAAELAAAFGEALTAEPCEAVVGEGLFSRLTCAGVQPLCRPLCFTYTGPEADLLLALTCGAGQLGLPLNKDTLPGPPAPYYKTEGELVLGKSCAGTPVCLPLDALPKGSLILGAPGSGKGNSLIGLSVQLAKYHVPTLIIESAKEEMHHLAKAGLKLNTWRPIAGEYLFNPFSMPPGITLGEYRSALLQTLRSAFRMEGPLEQLFRSALDRCFCLHGFTDDSTIDSPGVEPFGLSEVMEAFSEELLQQGYSPKTEADMRTAGLVRLMALFNQSSAVYDTVRSVPVSELTREGLNLIQLAKLTSVEDKQSFATLLLISLSCWMRLNMKHSGGQTKLVVMLDEAHNLLTDCAKDADAAGGSYSFAREMANLILELRSVGVAFIIADQSSRNIPDVMFEVCQNKIFMGPSEASGIMLHAAEMKLDDAALQNLWRVEPGQGFYRRPEMPQAVYFAAPNLIDMLHIETPCVRTNTFLELHPRFTVESFAQCVGCPAKGQCQLADKTAARALSGRLLALWKAQFNRALCLPVQTEDERKARSRQLSALLQGLLLDAKAQSHGSRNIFFCGVVQFVRGFNREARVKLSVEKMLGYAQKLK